MSTDEIKANLDDAATSWTRRMEQDRAEMTPLELLAVGVIVVLVWMCGKV